MHMHIIIRQQIHNNNSINNFTKATVLLRQNRSISTTLRRPFFSTNSITNSMPTTTATAATTATATASSTGASSTSTTSQLKVISQTRVIEQAPGYTNTSGPTSSSSSSEFENGCYHRISHQSVSTSTKMTFGLFLPSTYSTNQEDENLPVLYWLSGLTCDDTNFAMKAGSRAFEAAEKQGIAIVMPDTSPRNDDSIPDVDSYDLGIGAGFYINATAAPYNQHYHMYDYITKELPSILSTTLNIGKDGLKSISGHSMGGHGALTIALKNGVTEWKSVSAFSPICNPTNVPWGEKAFKAYLGSIEAGKAYDATCILEGLTGEGGRMLSYDNILIDQGTADNFLEEQLKPQVLVDAGQKVGQKITLNMRNGFDHSYYFIAAFIESHVEYHGRYLNQASKR